MEKESAFPSGVRIPRKLVVTRASGRKILELLGKSRPNEALRDLLGRN